VGPLLFVNNLPSWQLTFEHELQTVAAARVIEEFIAGRDMHVVLAGDFDATPDYVFVHCVEQGPTLDVSACERIFDKPVDGVWASDHVGVVADLALTARGPGSWSLGRRPLTGSGWIAV
jgi:hypothetical protein